MTKNDTSSAQQAGSTFTGVDGVQRRTIVAGAAWTIPVVATAIGAPLAAASTTSPTLAFTNGPYTVAACGTLKDVVIRATTDGTAPVPAGTLVTVTLPTGLTWSDESTGTRILPTDANGEVVLSGVTATGTAGSRTISATSGAAEASAPVSVTGGAAFRSFIHSGEGIRYTNAVPVPTGAQPVGTIGWLQDGTLYDSAGVVIAVGVASANGDFENWGTENGQYFSWITTSGAPFASTFRSSEGRRYIIPVTVPTGAQPVGTVGWLLNGTLYDSTGAIIATDVTSAEGDFENWGFGNGRYLSYTTGNGTAFRSFIHSGEGIRYTNAVPVPSGAQPVGTIGWLQDGTLYDSAGVVIATDVATANGDFENWGTENGQYFSWITTDGKPFASTFRSSEGRRYIIPVTVPNGAQPIGTVGWLLDGTLYSDTGAIIATDVTSAEGDFENWGSGNGRYLNYTTGAVCS